MPSVTLGITMLMASMSLASAAPSDSAALAAAFARQLAANSPEHDGVPLRTCVLPGALPVLASCSRVALDAECRQSRACQSEQRKVSVDPPRLSSEDSGDGMRRVRETHAPDTTPHAEIAP